MLDTDTVYYFLFTLSILQSIVGVGILLIGTPVLLFFKFSLVDSLYVLLPLSMLTSFNVLIMEKLINKSTINIDKEIKLKFLFITIPSVLIGLILIKNFGDFINFKYLVSAVILTSIIILNTKKFLNKLNKKINNIFLTLTGIIHGLSNAGGSILILLFSIKNNKIKSRYYITYFYFLLAFFQYGLLLLIFDFKYIDLNFKILFSLIIFGSILGNFLVGYIDNKFFKNLINILAVLSCLFLITS